MNKVYDYVKVAEAAGILGVSQNTVRAWAETPLRIRNFKGWKDTGLIRMAPITLLFGANSSGKSRIGQYESEAK